ncbi:MAG: AraC family transcriptional regulator [Bacillota bacterium]|nr:MAG: AraC family transcriptional regulator [Bacillota bacterium]
MKKTKIYKEIKTDDISPALIRTYAYNLNKRDWGKGKFPSRLVETYEFEFIIESEGYMNLEGKRYPLKPGDLCLRRPSEITMGEPPYSCYMISFALTNDTLVDKIQPYYVNEILDALPPVLSTKNPKYYELIFQKILEQYIKNESSSQLLIKSLILEIIYAAYQEVKFDYLPSSAYVRIIKNAIHFMENHYTDRLTLEKIADEVGLSPSHFQRIFKKTMNLSPNDYLVNYRLMKAKELLLITHDTITDISFLCGFESNAYFSYVFKTHMLMTPSMYRKSHQKP